MNNAIIMNVDSLPLQIRERLHTKKVSVEEKNGNIILSPLKEGSGLLGIAKDDKLTVDKFLAYKKRG